MNSIIVTGAAGMIGAAIVKEALARGMRVLAVVRKNSPNMGNLFDVNSCSGLQTIECEINSYRDLCFDTRYDAFIHTAWQNTGAAYRDDVYSHTDNIKYTIDAVYAAHKAGCGVFIDTGSQAEYGGANGKLSGDTACNPNCGYGTAKYAAGKMARITAAKLGIRSCHTRILSVYGEGMGDNTVIIYLIKTLLAGDKPSLTKCEQIWDYLYVSDAARAFLAIAEHGRDGKVYPIGSGYERPMYEYFEIIRNIINPGIKLGIGEKEYYPHQPMYLCADITELENDTGFRPAVDFEDGIRKTIEWVRKQSV